MTRIAGRADARQTSTARSSGKTAQAMLQRRQVCDLLGDNVFALHRPLGLRGDQPRIRLTHESDFN